MKLEQIAKLAHEVNRAYCRAIGDSSQPTWENAPKWQKESIINGVKYHLENPSISPEMAHKNWLREKEKLGWKYGEIKDPIKKEHPCMVEYFKLPKEQKAKDYIFQAICNFALKEESK